MAKAVLVMDKPDNCCECPFMSWASEDHYCRMGDDGNGGCSVTGGQRPHWCPLISIPKRKEDYIDEDTMVHPESFFIGYCTGFNACLDALEGNNETD